MAMCGFFLGGGDMNGVVKSEIKGLWSSCLWGEQKGGSASRQTYRLGIFYAMVDGGLSIYTMFVTEARSVLRTSAVEMRCFEQARVPYQQTVVNIWTGAS